MGAHLCVCVFFEEDTDDDLCVGDTCVCGCLDFKGFPPEKVDQQLFFGIG